MSETKLPPKLQETIDEAVIEGLKKELAVDLTMQMIIREQIFRVGTGDIGAFEWLMKDGNWQLGAAYYRLIEDGRKTP